MNVACRRELEKYLLQRTDQITTDLEHIPHEIFSYCRKKNLHRMIAEVIERSDCER
jgi:hypothetical protein